MSEDLKLTATVIGGEQLKQRFLDLAGGIRARIRSTLSAVGATIRDAIAANTPIKSGAGAASWRASIRETNDRIALTVAPGKFYLRFLEFGVVNHGTRNNTRALSAAQLKKVNVRRGLVQRVRELRSQGQYRIAPRPFAGPVAEVMIPAAQDQINVAIAEALQES